MPTLSGTVKDSVGNLAPRAVRAYRKSDGALSGATTSDPTTGAFSIPALDGTAHFAVVHDCDADPYWDNVVLAMHMDDAGLTDAKGNAVTINGNAARSATQRKFGGYSAYFDGSGDYLSTSSSALAVGAGDITIEGWVYRNTSTISGLFQISATPGGLFAGITNTLAVGFDAGNVWRIYAAGVAVNSVATCGTGAFVHFALVRSSGVTTLYADGVSVITVVDTTDYTGAYIAIGGFYSSSYVLNGYVDDFRVTTKARYTENFTPPSGAFVGAMTSGAANALIYDDLIPV